MSLGLGQLKLAYWAHVGYVLFSEPSGELTRRRGRTTAGQMEGLSCGGTPSSGQLSPAQHVKSS